MFKFDFVPNLPDDTHCRPASFTMIWQALAGEKIAMADAETRTGWIADPEKLPWEFASILSFAEGGFRIKWIEDFLLDEFVKDIRGELLRRFPNNPEIVEHEVAGIDFENEMGRAEKILSWPAVERVIRRPNVDDLREVLGEGAAVLLNVNSKALNGLEGYMGHTVFVSGCSEEGFVLQDPGLPPDPARFVIDEQLLRGWHWPDDAYANLVAVYSS